MIAISLQSGSNGNCIYVEAEGVRLLFDAGISGIQAEQRLAALGRDIRKVDALIISHDHADHLRCAGIYQRKYGIPLHITPRTLAAGKPLKLGRLVGGLSLSGRRRDFLWKRIRPDHPDPPRWGRRCGLRGGNAQKKVGDPYRPGAPLSGTGNRYRFSGRDFSGKQL